MAICMQELLTVYTFLTEVILKKAAYHANSSFIAEGNVEDIVVDRYNRIWFASIEYGVGVIDPDEPNLQPRYFNPVANTAPLQDTKVSKLCFDSKGYLWVGTRGNGLYKFDTTLKQFEAIATENTTSLYKSIYAHYGFTARIPYLWDWLTG